MLQFTVLTSWETVLRDIGDRWALDVSRVRVKFVTPDSYKTLSSYVKYYLPVYNIIFLCKILSSYVKYYIYV